MWSDLGEGHPERPVDGKLADATRQLKSGKNYKISVN
jgi:hypothetical protein